MLLSGNTSMICFNGTQVTFCPILCGKYEADVEVFASYMIGADHSQSGPPAATFVLQAEVEQPQLELRSRHLRSNGSDRVLDYGLMVGGSTVKCPLELINRGRVELPLEMTIVSDVSEKLLRIIVAVLDSMSSEDLRHRRQGRMLMFRHVYMTFLRYVYVCVYMYLHFVNPVTISCYINTFRFSVLGCRWACLLTVIVPV